MVAEEIRNYTTPGIGRARLLAELRAAERTNLYWRRPVPTEFYPDFEGTLFAGDESVLLTFGMLLPEGSSVLEMVDLSTLAVVETDASPIRYLRVEMTYDLEKERWLWVNESFLPVNARGNS